jgi:hypothetical protein
MDPVSDFDVATKSYVDSASWSEPIVTVTADPAPASVNTTYMVNTSGGAFNITLPASPAAGSRITFVDQAGTFATNHLTLIATAPDQIQAPVTLRYANQSQTIVYDANVWYASQGTFTQRDIEPSPNYAMISNEMPQTIANGQATLPTTQVISGNLSKVNNGLLLRPYGFYKVIVRARVSNVTSTNSLNLTGTVSGITSSINVELIGSYTGSVLTSQFSYLTTGSQSDTLTLQGSNSNSFILEYVSLEVVNINRTGLNLCSISGFNMLGITNEVLPLTNTVVQYGDLVHTGSEINVLAGKLYRITAAVQTTSVPNAQRKTFQVRGSVSGNLFANGQLTNKGFNNNACSCSSLSTYFIPSTDETLGLRAGNNTSTSVDIASAYLDIVEVTF